MKWLLPLLLLCSCGYHFDDGGIAGNYRTISVPWVNGDEDGRLTEAIAKEVATSSGLNYSNCGRLRLDAKIVNCGRENIGFRYDRNSEGRLTDRIVANEGRIIQVVEFSVVDTSNCCTLIGPILIKAHQDYDFNPLETDTELTVFSVGQLVNIDRAEEAARSPLYAQTARKIVAYLNAAW